MGADERQDKVKNIALPYVCAATGYDVFVYRIHLKFPLILILIELEVLEAKCAILFRTERI